MRTLSLTKMMQAGEDGDFEASYSLEQFVAANSGWKIVYNINEKYFVEDIIAYTVIKCGSYHEILPVTLPDLHLSQSLQEYILKDGYIGMITPENELIINEYMVDDINSINIRAIKKALYRNRFSLNNSD